MEQPEVNTREGRHVSVFVKNVAITFEGVTKEGVTTVKELDSGPEPSKGEKISFYYKIKTTAEYAGKIKIRIVLPCEGDADERKLYQWIKEKEKWKEITKRYNARYHTIVGVTEHLSIFGVT
jgi:hypothetical protein